MSFYNEITRYNWEEIGEQIYSKTEEDVVKALSKTVLDLSDFQSLISPTAEKYLEQMAQKSREVTQQRFGKCMQMYIPLYLSNSCTNHCVYCGFNHSNQFERTILTEEEVRVEAQAIKKLGFEHILLVSGEDQKQCGSEYLGRMMDELKDDFALISLEAQPLDIDEYEMLIEKKLNTVYVYQETYCEANYKNYHPRGKKSNFRYRLETPDRLGKAGVHKIGLGCLLGLEDWRIDTFFTALHLQYLERTYWKSKYSISFPRLRPHVGAFQPRYETTERDLLQLICAYRLLNPHVEISLSTRERSFFRDNALQLGPTSYSAGSKTNPGGYANKEESLEQFSVNDDRSVNEIADMIHNHGYEVVWKDWDQFMQT
ncbi:2-iminoacetate synthase ThiH [Prolixibacteraceae bacterium JC049]|nr:2-iminoacetate synthase ThiH [Prolixibacteraceae bacterium JC049]